MSGHELLPHTGLVLPLVFYSGGHSPRPVLIPSHMFHATDTQ